MNLIEDAAESAVEVLAPEAAIPAKIAAWLLGDAWRLVAIAALLAVGVQELRIVGVTIAPKAGPFHFTLLDLPGWKPRAIAAEKALAMVKAEQPKAAAAQAAVNHEPAARSAAIAKVSDDDAQTYYAKGRAAGAAYALAHPAGGLCASANRSSPGQADLPGADHPAPVHDGPGDTAGMVALSRADFDQLTANSLRLAKVHQDAESLIMAGVAIPEVAGGGAVK